MADGKVFDLSVILRVIDKASAATQKIESKFKALETKLEATGKKMSTIGKNMMLKVTLPIVGLGVAALKTAGDFQKQTVAFETLLGSTEKAKSLLKDITDFSAKTPFQLPGLIDGSTRLLAFGFSADKVVETMTDLGNAAMGDQFKLDQLVNAFGKVRARGKASMRELNMFIYAGVPILDALAEQFNTTTEGVLEMSSKGEVSFDAVNKALMSLTRGTGKYAGMIEKMSHTFVGAWSTFLDNLKLVGREFGNILLPIATKVILKLTKFAQWLRDLDERTKKWIISILLIVAAIGPLIFIIGKLMLMVSGIMKAFRLLSLIMTPQGLIILGIVAAIALLIIIILKWKKIVAAIHKIWKKFINYIQTMPRIIVILIAAFAPFLLLPVLIIRHWSKLAPWFEKTWDKIKKGTKASLSWIKKNSINLWHDIKEFWEKSGIGDFVKEWIIDPWVSSFKWIVDELTKLWEKISGSKVFKWLFERVGGKRNAEKAIEKVKEKAEKSKSEIDIKVSTDKDSEAKIEKVQNSGKNRLKIYTENELGITY